MSWRQGSLGVVLTLVGCSVFVDSALWAQSAARSVQDESVVRRSTATSARRPASDRTGPRHRLAAQKDSGELDVSFDNRLPSLPNRGTSKTLPPAESLPAVEPSSSAPKIDRNAVEELPPSLRMAPIDDDADEPLRMDESSLMDEFIDSETEEEIVPHEIIRERYPDGKVKIERGVAQDERENYVNHGPWRMWDEDGNLVAEGQFRFGKRNGKWVRWYRAGETGLLTSPPYNLYNGPYLSRATFHEGQLNGQWIITDKTELKISQWNFVDGRRHGESIWYYHTGRRMRVIHYQHGELHGELLEWDVDGNLVTRTQYAGGRRHEKTVQTYEDGQKKVEGTVLQARLIMKEPDDWPDAKMATYIAKGKDQKHGEWTAWFPNGQRRFSGEYQLDKPAGDFTWWHTNGQKSLQAFYEEGMKHGQWMWWHENGQKSIHGQYQDNSPIGRWVWWHPTGKVAQRIDFSAAGATVARGDGRIMSEAVMMGPSQ